MPTMRVFRSATGSKRTKGSGSTIWESKGETTTSSDLLDWPGQLQSTLEAEVKNYKKEPVQMSSWATSCTIFRHAHAHISSRFIDR